MGFEINWLIKDEIIYARFWGKGDADELHAALTEIARMRDESFRDVVHTITNTKQVEVVVPFQESMKIVREFQTANYDGWEIVVGNLNKVIQLSLKIARSLLRTKSINFKTMQEALDHLRKEDPTINWENLNQSLVEDNP
ncbi:MAG: hypothetical protein WBC91_22230 [Phototrophicaceae bacterium]